MNRDATHTEAIGGARLDLERRGEQLANRVDLTASREGEELRGGRRERGGDRVHRT